MKVSRINLLWIILMLTFSFHSYGQPFTFSVHNKQFSFSGLTIEDGLSQNSVVSMAQDSMGYFWFATQDGLNKYDGHSFIHYQKQFEDVTRQNYSRLGKIYFDKLNKLWLITNSGKLEYYDEVTDQFIWVENLKSVSNICQDQNLNYYIGTYDNGLYKIDASNNDTIQLLKKEDVSKSINDLVVHQNSVLASGPNAFFKIENDSYQNLIGRQELVNYSSIAKSKTGKIWIGSYGNGLFYLDAFTNKIKPFVQLNNFEIPDNLNIEGLLFDSKNRLWIATYGDGAYLLDFEDNKVYHFYPEKYNDKSISYKDVISLYEDRTGNVWLGTDGAGLSYYDEYLYKFNILNNNNLPQNINLDVIRAICVDDNNSLWVGTSGNGLAYINSDENKTIMYTTDNSGLSSNRIVSLLAVNEEVWIGHQDGGLNILNLNGNIEQFNKSSTVPLPASTIWSILQRDKTSAWFGTNVSGLILFDKNLGVIEQYQYNEEEPHSLPSNNIRAIVKGSGNQLWIGTENKGLCMLNTETKEIQRIPGLIDNIKSLFFDGENTIWIGTNGAGLKMYNIQSKEILSFDTNNGLSNNVIYSILSDSKGDLWLSSNRGLTKFDTQDYSASNYNTNHGLQAYEFNTGAAFKDKNGLIYFGGLKGLNWFNPNNLSVNLELPKTTISKFEIFSQEQDLIQNKKYQSNQNTVTFSFSSLHFSLPKSNMYKYQLVNHDEDWIYSGNNNTAHYTNLSPGKYQFKVMSSNYDGIWNESPAVYSFQIKEPWYLSLAAVFIYILAFFAIGFFIYLYFKRQWRMKMQIQMEHNETERLKKMYTNISHDFRTPLTLILGPIENQLAKHNISEEDRNDLDIVQRNSKRLLNLVDQLLELSKLESGYQKLEVKKDDLSLLINQLIESFIFQAKKKDIELTYQVQESALVWFDSNAIEKILMNLLWNAIKYTPFNGNIDVNSTIKDGMFNLQITNTCVDIDIDKLELVFKRFYQNKKDSDGIGIGLSIVQELANLCHGDIEVKKIKGDRICFEVKLPIHKEAYESYEIVESDEKNEEILEDFDHTLIDNPILLIVEDNNEVRTFIKSIFKDEFVIYEAENGKEGISKALQYIPNVIISDVMMPEVDGIELCNTLKQNEKTSHVPIILLTAKVGEENEILGLKTGADAYVTKPFNVENLKVRVRNLLEIRLTLQKRYRNGFELDESMDNDADKIFLERLKKVLDESLFQSEFNAAALSKAMLVSRMQLHRKLKALTGESASELIRNQRLKKALFILKNSNITISELAYTVGFNTPSYFIKSFKEEYGKTPLEYLQDIDNH